MRRTGKAGQRPEEQKDTSKQAQDEADPKTVDDPIAHSSAPSIPSAVVTFIRHPMRDTHHPMNPYNRCVLVRPRKLNAESPSKNCVSGMTPPAASRLNQPLEEEEEDILV